MKTPIRKFLVCILSFSLVGVFSIVPVKAEMDIIYPPDYSYSAYDYFFSRGYNHLLLTSSDNITYNVSLDNIGSNNGSITGSDNLTGSAHNTGTINSNGSSTLGAKYMVCSTNNGTSASQTYSCYFSNRQNAVSNSQSINIGFNENSYSDYSNVDVSVNETIKQSINTDITGSITSSTRSNTYSYLPWLNGTYSHPSSFAYSNSVYITNSGSGKFKQFIFSFYSNERLLRPNTSSATYFSMYFDPEVSGRDYNLNLGFVQLSSTLFLNYFIITCNSGEVQFTFDLPRLNSQPVIPYYMGYYSSIPDECAVMLGLRQSTNVLMNNGDYNTSSIVSDANNANSQVSQKIGQFDSIENNSVNDMSSKINNLNVTPDILANSKFISSASWVKQQFDHITVGTPIGSVLAFSLILGVALIFVGKYR